MKKEDLIFIARKEFEQSIKELHETMNIAMRCVTLSTQNLEKATNKVAEKVAKLEELMTE